MSTAVEYGVVSTFKKKDLFGFIRVMDRQGNLTREEVFFHYDEGRMIIDDGSQPVFGSKEVRRNGSAHYLPHPKRGDTLVFFRVSVVGKKKSRQKDIARPWGFAQHWHGRTQKLAKQA